MKQLGFHAHEGGRKQAGMNAFTVRSATVTSRLTFPDANHAKHGQPKEERGPESILHTA